MALSRRAAFVSLLFLTSIAVLAALLLQSGFPILESDQSLGSNVSFLALINVNIIAVMILAFIVVRNIVRLIIDRRRNILGARLRTRLVFAFVFLSMVPTILLFLVAKGMVDGVLQDWFSPKVEVALESSGDLAHQYYDTIENDIKRSHQMALPLLLEKVGGKSKNFPSMNLILNQIPVGEENKLFVIDSKSRILASSIKKIVEKERPSVADAGVGIQGRLNLSRRFFEVKDQEVFVSPEQFGDLESLFSISRLPEGLLDPKETFYFVVKKEISQGVSQAVKSLLNATEEYRVFKSYHRPMASSYILTLVVVTLLIIFAAISIAFFLSRSISVPIGLLARGTEQIANGNLNYHIPEVGDDELGVLVRGFNKMTSDLKDATGELVTRSRYIEAVLSCLEVGVFSIGTDNILRTFNDAGRRILGVSDASPLLDRPFAEVLPIEFVNSIAEINQRNLRGKNQVVSKNISYLQSGSQRHLVLTISRLFEENTREEVGLVVLVEDVTDLERAQRMAAWQEVARRIAHEIKNPLTPIQLSAERIARIKDRMINDGSETSERKIIEEATEVIISQVQNLRQLVNEFSNFARMPKSELRMGALNDVVKSSVDAFRTAHREIDFDIQLHDDLPDIMIDPHQIERVLINLLDNSVAAMEIDRSMPAKLKVETHWDQFLSLVTLEVSDNGPGVSDKDKQRIFEPYYSKKPNGTGLGLAIVKSVISDHNGFIRALSNPSGRGLTIRIELPVVF